jgi:hypothetical protein
MRLLGLALAVVLLLAGRAEARRESSLRYPYSLVWTTAVRMVRVDYSSPITEKDKEEGYFLFQFSHAGKEYPGSFEILRGEEESDARVVVQIPAMPSYFEQMLIDKLERKLKQEYGSPREKVIAPPSEKKPEPAEPAEPKEPKDGQAPDQPAAPKEG